MRHRDGAVELHDRRAAYPRELVIERCDPHPVALLPGVQRGDLGLQHVGTAPAQRQRAPERRATVAYPPFVPQRAVLIGEQHDLPIAPAGVTARVVQQHQRQQTAHLGLVGHQLHERATEADRLLRELARARHSRS